MRDAKAMQMLLDGCRRCYWVIQEPDSIDNFAFTGTKRSLGEVNALVDELLVVIELLLGAASSTAAADDVRCLIGFIVDCPQPNQVLGTLLTRQTLSNFHRCFYPFFFILLSYE